MTPRSREQDAARKRLERKKQREQREAQQAAQLSDEQWQEQRNRELAARLLAKLAYDGDPQRDVERVDRAIQWLHDAEKAAGDLAELTRISRELRSTLNSDYIGCSGGLSIIDRDVLRSWNGIAWTKVGDIRRVIMADLEERGLMKQFEEKLKQEKQETK